MALMAAMQALNAASIDTMLPALPRIGSDFAVVNDNRLQWIITAYVMGSGCGQLIYGEIWRERNELILTNPTVYAEIINALNLSSEPMHHGTAINVDGLSMNTPFASGQYRDPVGSW